MKIQATQSPSQGLTVAIDGVPVMTIERNEQGYIATPLSGPDAGRITRLVPEPELRDRTRYANSGTKASVGDRVYFADMEDDDRADIGEVVAVDHRGWATVAWNGPTATSTLAPSDLHISD